MVKRARARAQDEIDWLAGLLRKFKKKVKGKGFNYECDSGVLSSSLSSYTLNSICTKP